MVREGDAEPADGETAQRILIVDDAPLNRAILREMLGGEFQLAEAADGGNGLYYYALPWSRDRAPRCSVNLCGWEPLFRPPARLCTSR